MSGETAPNAFHNEDCPICGSDDIEYDTPLGPMCADCGCALDAYEDPFDDGDDR